MKRIQNILLIVLIALSVTAFGQETDWEKEDLQGKVKKYELFSYDFDISDSINHDEFMNRFYHCDFDVDRMIRFADSIKTEKDSYYNTIHEYDSLGQFTKLHDAHYINEYDDSGRILKRSIVEEDVPKDTIFLSMMKLVGLWKENIGIVFINGDMIWIVVFWNTYTRILKWIQFLSLKNMTMTRTVS